MTKRLLVSAVVATIAFLGITLESQANGGLFRRSAGCCDTPCATTAAAAPVKYEERKVTAYKYVTTEKDIDVIVCKTVTRDVKFTYTVNVLKTTQEKRKETVHVRKEKEVEYKYTVLVPKTVQKVVKQTTYDCIRENVTEQVPVCRLVRVTCVDACGRCRSHLERQTVMEQRTRCVTKKVAVTKDVTINEVICEKQEKVGKKIVCEYVPEVREVTVNVCSCVQEKREGTRKVCEVVRETVKRKVNVCERVAYETTVRVAIGGGACATSCDPCHSGHGHRSGGGLFRRTGSCCN